MHFVSRQDTCRIMIIRVECIQSIYRVLLPLQSKDIPIYSRIKPAPRRLSLSYVEGKLNSDESICMSNGLLWSLENPFYPSSLMLPHPGAIADCVHAVVVLVMFWCGWNTTGVA